MDKLYSEDFNMVESNVNGVFVRISGLNQMIECGAIQVDRKKLQEYKFDTRVSYDKSKYTKEEAMKKWLDSR